MNNDFCFGIKMHLGQIDVEGNATALVSMTDPKSESDAVQGQFSITILLQNAS